MWAMYLFRGDCTGMATARVATTIRRPEKPLHSCIVVATLAVAMGLSSCFFYVLPRPESYPQHASRRITKTCFSLMLYTVNDCPTHEAKKEKQKPYEHSYYARKRASL